MNGGLPTVKIVMPSGVNLKDYPQPNLPSPFPFSITDTECFVSNWTHALPDSWTYNGPGENPGPIATGTLTWTQTDAQGVQVSYFQILNCLACDDSNGNTFNSSACEMQNMESVFQSCFTKLWTTDLTANNLPVQECTVTSCPTLGIQAGAMLGYLEPVLLGTSLVILGVHKIAYLRPCGAARPVPDMA